MGRIEYEDEARAVVHADDFGRPIARVYHLQDGWHVKLTDVHTKKAWFGPFDSPEQAVTAIT